MVRQNMRKPTSLHLLDGTAASNPAEPEPRGWEAPPCPKRLAAEERKVWKALSDTLEAMRVVTRDDWMAFEMLVCLWVEYSDMRDVIRKKGATYESRNSSGHLLIRPRPEMTQLPIVEKRLIALISRFGLTPADRSRVDDIKKLKEIFSGAKGRGAKAGRKAFSHGAPAADEDAEFSA